MKIILLDGCDYYNREFTEKEIKLLLKKITIKKIMKSKIIDYVPYFNIKSRRR